METKELVRLLSEAFINFTDAERAAAEDNRQTLKDEGFPDLVTRAFLDTADAELVRSIVLTRVPGRAAGQLIEERYDLKGFSIKAKSCNWGPMAGFLCMHPSLSKKGYKEKRSNLKANHNYLLKLATESDSIAPERELRDNGVKYLDKAFVPLVISNARRESLMKSWETLPADTFTKEVRAVYKQKDDDYVGAAWNGEDTVLEFILSSNGGELAGTYSLYQGRVYVLDGADGSWKIDDFHISDLITYPQAERDNANRGALDKASCWDPVTIPSTGPALTECLRALLTIPTLNGLDQLLAPPDDSKKWTRISGIQNPYPAYSGSDAYRNAVAGDYDLFAVWPGLPATSMRRTSEYNSPALKRGAVPAPEPLFEKVPGRRFCVSLAFSPNVLIDVVPGFAELSEIEDPEVGNISEHIETTAQVLNSFVSSAYLSPSGAEVNANVAFHSDECGRPGVTEVEYPVAAFLPSVYADALNRKLGRGADRMTRTLLLGRHVELLSLVCLLKDDFFVTLNSGWLLQWTLIWCALTPDVGVKAGERVPEDKKYTEYKAARRAEAAGMVADGVQFRALLEDLIFGSNSPSLDSDKRKAAMVFLTDKLADGMVANPDKPARDRVLSLTDSNWGKAS